MRQRPSRTKPSLVTLPWRMLRDTRAATAIEYGLIVAIIVIGMMASFIGVADITREMWNNISVKVTKAR